MVGLCLSVCLPACLPVCQSESDAFCTQHHDRDAKSSRLRASLCKCALQLRTGDNDLHEVMSVDTSAHVRIIHLPLHVRIHMQWLVAIPLATPNNGEDQQGRLHPRAQGASRPKINTDGGHKSNIEACQQTYSRNNVRRVMSLVTIWPLFPSVGSGLGPGCGVMRRAEQIRHPWFSLEASKSYGLPFGMPCCFSSARNCFKSR